MEGIDQQESNQMMDKKSTCPPECQNSYSKRCRCSCGGRNHGTKTGIAAEFGRDKDSGLKIFRLPGKKTYIGETHGELTYVVKVRNDKGQEAGLNPRWDLVNHSPDGFAWGYGGSGPSQLALAILCDVLPSDEMAMKYYHDFKREVIAGLGDNWEITEDQVIEAMKKIVGVKLEQSPANRSHIEQLTQGAT